MKKHSSQLTTAHLWLCAFLFALGDILSQNGAQQWRFGDQGGLQFMYSFQAMLPMPAQNSVMNTNEACASVCDTEGNLLFYTDGETVYNRNDAIMNNGSGLSGSSDASQGALIVKRPGSANIYYIFTQNGSAGGYQHYYNIVDMDLENGDGSVTSKNNLLYGQSLEKLCAVRHCNGNDIWILSHGRNTNAFYAILLTTSGVSTPVISNAGNVYSGSTSTWEGCMKASPNGRLLACANADRGMDMFDFDQTTGLVSNARTILSPAALSAMFTDPDAPPGCAIGEPKELYGCEFSPNNTKLYATLRNYSAIFQWDISSGSEPVISASIYTVTYQYNWIGALQLAPDGKIYITLPGRSRLSAIDKPDFPGAACQFRYNGPWIGGQSAIGLPNFVAFTAPPSYSVNCGRQVTFFAPPGVINPTWDFGDPDAGPANTSTLANPGYTYNSNECLVQLTFHNGCFQDTVFIPVSINNYTPVAQLQVPSAICLGASATVQATEPSPVEYFWSNGATGNSITLSPAVTNEYTLTTLSTQSGCSSLRQFTIEVSPCVSIFENSFSKQSIQVYPNPVDAILYVRGFAASQIKISDPSGRLIRTVVLDKDETHIDISDLTPGLYLLSSAEDLSGLHIKILKK